MTILLWIVAVVLVVAGLLGLLLPALPGPPLVFLGLVVAAGAEGFAHVGWSILLALALLAALAWGVDPVAGALDARHFGATGHAVAGDHWPRECRRRVVEMPHAAPQPTPVRSPGSPGGRRARGGSSEVAPRRLAEAGPPRRPLSAEARGGFRIRLRRSL